MAILKVQRTKDYTVMSTYHLKDKNLSLKAKGMLSVVLQLPEDWKYSFRGLYEILQEGETAIKSTLNELKKQKYLEISKLKNEKGQFEYVYTFYEYPGGGFNPMETNTKINKLKKKNENIFKKENHFSNERNYTSEELDHLIDDVEQIQF